MTYRPIRFGLNASITPVVRNLLLINAGLFIVQLLGSDSGVIETWLALWPDQVIAHWMLWQLVTYMFLHGSVLHILFNLFALWMFGCDVERRLGSGRFLSYYLITGVGAALFHMAFNWSSPNPVLGASGAIYGVLVAFAVLFPEREITLLLFFVLPIHLKAKYLAAIFMLFSLFAGIQGQMSGASGGVAHLAHLGGGLVGFILLRGANVLGEKLFEFRKRMQWRKMARQKARADKEKKQRMHIDVMLDKINRVGWENLTAKEKSELKKAAERLEHEK